MPTSRRLSGAQTAGQLRADFIPEDLVLLPLAHAGVLRNAAPLAGQRLLGLILDACRAGCAHALPSPPATKLHLARRGLVRPTPG
jgi:hypothetical protein